MQIIDLTSTWQQILPALIVVLQDGTPEGKKTAKIELQKMAKAADLYNLNLKTLNS